MMTFGAVLKRMRMQRWMSQPKLGKACDVTAGYISRLEDNQRHPSHEVVLRLAVGLEATAEERYELLAAAGYRSERDPDWAPELLHLNQVMQDAPPEVRAGIREAVAGILRVCGAGVEEVAA